MPACAQVGGVRISLAGGFVGLVDVRVKLDRDPAVVARCQNRPQCGQQIDRAMTGDQVSVYASGRNVLEMVMPGVGRHLGHPILRCFAHAVGVTDVEVQSQPRRIDPLDEFQELAEALDHQLGLGLNEQANFETLGDFHAGHQLFVEDVGRLAPCLAGSERAARLGLHVFRARLLSPTLRLAWCVRGGWRGSSGRARSRRDANTAGADRPRRSS